MNVNRPITEDDIQGYVDGALDTARQADVRDYLSNHPDTASKVSRMIEQRQMMRDRFAPIVNEPIPPELSVRHLLDRRTGPPRYAWRSIAAAVLFTVGGLSGWAMRDLSTPDRVGIGALTEEAFYSYATFGEDTNRPVEMKASESADLVRWMSHRLQRPVEVPDLSGAGYRFIGGRVVATANGPAGMFMYEDQGGGRIAMVLRPMKIEVSAPMRERSINAVGTVSWVDAGIGYSLVGNTPPRRLHPIADEVRRQIADQI